ncbi:MAG: multidrug effflux MFS transporter [Gammaproteobacteria bacterium]|nr:multidrug effflux MFS transporter [Gammaproteobacteria bacterium]NNK97714.1 multidrug effflux MFS transporter [Xanthomonadales bacterium]
MPGTSKGIQLTRPGTGHLTIIAALLAMIGPFSIDAYLPSFPDIETEFQISRAMLSQSLAVYLLAFAVSTLFWGPMADRFGRRLVILISMALYTLGSVACALADSASTFMLLRIVQGLAASGGFIAGRAMIRDAHDAEGARHAMSQVMLLFALAPAVAPVLGGWLHDQFGWRSVFWFLGAFGSLLVLMGFFITETLAHENRRSIHPASVVRVYISAILHPRFPALVFCLSVSFAGLFLYIAGAPAVIYSILGLESSDFGWLFIPIVGGLMLGATISGRLAHRWPAKRTISTGVLVMVLATALNFVAVNVADAGIIAVIGPLVLYVIGLAVMMPAITVLALDCLPSHRGTAASMQGFLQMVTNAVVASIMVPMLGVSWLHFVYGQACFLLLAAGIWYWLQRSPT